MDIDKVKKANPRMPNTHRGPIKPKKEQESDVSSSWSENRIKNFVNPLKYKLNLINGVDLDKYYSSRPWLKRPIKKEKVSDLPLQMKPKMVVDLSKMVPKPS